MKLRLSHKQMVSNCETPKAICIAFNRGDLLYLPKKVCTYEENIIEKNGLYWTTEYVVSIPTWLIEQMTMNQKIIINLIKDQWNKEKTSSTECNG
tara:strand:- start:3139 stop:3423 length:285 start_codon:yes stop_codon:yes gene_type:complete